MPSIRTFRQPSASPAPAKAGSLHKEVSVYVPARIMRQHDGTCIVVLGQPMVWLSVTQAARALQRTGKTVREWCADGRLVWQPRGKCLWVSAESVCKILGNDSDKELDALVEAKLSKTATLRTPRQ